MEGSWKNKDKNIRKSRFFPQHSGSWKRRKISLGNAFGAVRDGDVSAQEEFDECVGGGFMYLWILNSIEWETRAPKTP